jgi:hydroxymethylpyrimidine/phosphomethylpyrimidine kinase
MDAKLRRLPIALTIAGSDSGGGAGIQADLKTFASLGTHGVSVITCLTAQNPKRVLGVEACTPGMVRRQLQAVFDELPPDALKTGMLYSAEIIQTVAQFLRKHRPKTLVVDPVMVSTSGAQLLRSSAIALLKSRLLPLCDLVTPNLDEASLLVGRELSSVEDLRWAAKKLRQVFGCAALVKGGHLRGMKEAVDIYYDGSEELLLSAPFVRGAGTHGTGCTYSSAIAACLARGESLPDAVVLAKEYITQAIAGRNRAAGNTVLNSFWQFS